MPEIYPVPRYRFEVNVGQFTGSFTEVTGLVMEREKIEYRHSASSESSKIALPGLLKNNNVTLKRGKFEGDFRFNDWFDLVTNEREEERLDVTISLLNEKQEPVAAWTLARCFLLKVTASDLKSDANEVAIESIEIAHEGLKLMKF